MPWAVEQATANDNSVFRSVWFQNNLFNFVQRRIGLGCGVWQRDGIGPWVLRQAGNHPTYWEADGAFYTGGYSGVIAERPRVYRSTDGINWVLDWTIPAGWVANSAGIFGMEAYGSYLYCFVNDVGVDATILRRDRNGVWTDLPTGLAPVAQPQRTRGVIEFGGVRYWTHELFVRYWDGAAWVSEPTLDGQCGSSSWMSIIGNILYIGADSAYAHGGGYFWRTAGATNWSFLSLPVPDNTWSVSPLCVGGDGEVYTHSENGTTICVYRLDGNGFTIVSYEDGGVGMGSPGAPGVEPDGTMYIGSNWGVVRFYAFVPDYNLTPSGQGLPPQAVDCDADGDALYLALYDNAGNPILARVPLPLTATAMGSLMRNPGAGDAINVKCSEIGQQLAISGFFGANEQVEVSQDAGLTWSPVDPNWGNERAQPLEVGPEGLSDLMVCLDNLQDLYDTEDMGVAWTQRQAAIGYSPGSMRRKRNEVILGDDGANSIEYSPNKGQQLTDITGAFVGNVAALDVA